MSTQELKATGAITDTAGRQVEVDLDLLFTLPDVPPPPLFGFNYDVDGGLPAVADTLNCDQLTAAKVFNSKIPVTYPGHIIPATVTHPLVTIKVPLLTAAPWISQANQDLLAKVFASMPKTGTPMVTINQEGEAPRFGYTAEQVAGSHQTASVIFQTVGPANGIYCQDLQTYSASDQGRGAAFADYISCFDNGQQDLPLYLLDWYPTTPSTGAVDSVTPAWEAITGRVPGAVIGIAECNYTTSLSKGVTWSGPQDQWFTEAWAWATEQKVPLFMVYSLTAHGVPWPPARATVNELSRIAHISGL